MEKNINKSIGDVPEMVYIASVATYYMISGMCVQTIARRTLDDVFNALESNGLFINNLRNQTPTGENGSRRWEIIDGILKQLGYDRLYFITGRNFTSGINCNGSNTSTISPSIMDATEFTITSTSQQSMGSLSSHMTHGRISNKTAIVLIDSDNTKSVKYTGVYVDYILPDDSANITHSTTDERGNKSTLSKSLWSTLRSHIKLILEYVQ